MHSRLRIFTKMQTLHNKVGGLYCEKKFRNPARPTHNSGSTESRLQTSSTPISRNHSRVRECASPSFTMGCHPRRCSLALLNRVVVGPNRSASQAGGEECALLSQA